MARTSKKAATEAAEVKAETPIVTAPIAEEAPAEQKAPVEKKAPAKKPAAKKTAAPKKTEEKKPAAKKASAKKAAEKADTAEERKVVIQYGGAEVAGTELVEKAKADAGIKSAKSIVVYVRPEINKVYYVIDENVFGNYDLF